MSLLTGNRSLDKTVSKNIHYNMMFWLDEGLVEKGFWVNITSDFYMGNTNLYEVKQLDTNVYKFAYDRLIWETSVPSVFGNATRFSGVYVNGYPYANISSNYITDYHQGTITFNSSVWNGIVSSYGASPTITASYHAKQVYVNYDNNDLLKSQMGYIIQNYDKTINFEELPIKLPMIAGTLDSQKIFPYEIGGTRYIRVGYSLLVITDNQESRDQIADMILQQQDMRLPSRVWKPLYNEDNCLQYDTIDQYINDCDEWRATYIERIDEKRYGNGPYFADYNIALKVIGVY